METSENRRGKALVLTVRGRLDGVSSAAFERRLLELIDGGERCIVLDLGPLDYVSSAGLRSLLLGAKKMKTGSGILAVAAMREDTRQVFEISGFTTVFPIHKSVDDAVRKYA